MKMSLFYQKLQLKKSVEVGEWYITKPTTQGVALLIAWEECHHALASRIR